MEATHGNLATTPVKHFAELSLSGVHKPPPTPPSSVCIDFLEEATNSVSANRKYSLSTDDQRAMENQSGVRKIPLTS